LLNQFIAWAVAEKVGTLRQDLSQKYERGDGRFYELLADRVVVEEIISRRLWRNERSGSPWAPISVYPGTFQHQLGPLSEWPGSPGFTIPLD
jgi:hypothetical protein